MDKCGTGFYFNFNRHEMIIFHCNSKLRVSFVVHDHIQSTTISQTNSCARIGWFMLNFYLQNTIPINCIQIKMSINFALCFQQFCTTSLRKESSEPSYRISQNKVIKEYNHSFQHTQFLNTIPRVNIYALWRDGKFDWSRDFKERLHKELLESEVFFTTPSGFCCL